VGFFFFFWTVLDAKREEASSQVYKLYRRGGFTGFGMASARSLKAGSRDGSCASQGDCWNPKMGGVVVGRLHCEDGQSKVD